YAALESIRADFTDQVEHRDAAERGRLRERLLLGHFGDEADHHRVVVDDPEEAADRDLRDVACGRDSGFDSDGGLRSTDRGDAAERLATVGNELLRWTDRHNDSGARPPVPRATTASFT